jgi:type I restriction enzyme S subunit
MGLKPGCKQTEVGVIPEDWSVKRLGDIGEALIGLTYSPANVQSDGLLVLRSSNIADGRLRFEDNVFVKTEVPDKIIVREGDILICVRNGSRDLIGKCAKIDKRAEGMTFGAFMAVFRTDFHDFVFHQFQSDIVGRQIYAHLGATINQITNASLNSFRIPLPPTKAEQEAIAEALSDADALIESLEQLIAKKRQLKQGAMQELLTGKKRLPGLATKPGYKQMEVGVIPEDWEVMRVRDLIKHGPKNGYSGRSSQDSRGTPTLSLTATSSGRLLLNQDTVKYLENRVPADSPLFLEPGDILVQRSNTAELVGTTAIFNGPAATFVYPDLMMRLRFKKRATAEWFWRYANSTSGRRFFSRVAAGSTGSMPKISGDKLRDMVVPLPSLTEQEAIVTILSDMDAEVAALEAKLAKACQLKQGMMQELLTGRIRLV